MYRDYVYGCIYWVIYFGWLLIEFVKVDGVSIDELFVNFIFLEYCIRYCIFRELWGCDVDEVSVKLKIWVVSLDKLDECYEYYLLEGFWVSWGLNCIDDILLC